MHHKKLPSPLTWAGAKSNACEILAGRLPNDIKEMVSIFAGGASFELYCEKELGIKVTHAYDKFEPLIAFWQVISDKKQAERFVEEVSKIVGKGLGKEKYDEIKNRYYEHTFRGGEQIEDAFELACLFYIAHTLAFFPTPARASYCYSKTQDKESRVKNRLKRILDFNSNIKFELLSFEESIPRHPNAFLYLDPPYVLDGVKLKTECYAGHKQFDHHLLAEVVKTHKGKWMMSYGDCDLVRELYKDYNIEIVTWAYAMEKALMAQGKKENSYGGSEVIITNY